MVAEPIAGNMWEDPRVLAALIGGSAIFATTIINMLISWRIARATTKQNREMNQQTILANREAIVATKREEWGEKLRVELSELVTSATEASIIHKIDRKNMEQLKEVGLKVKRLVALIELRLNPDDKTEPHAQLIDELKKLKKNLKEEWCEEGYDGHISDICQNILRIAQTIFKCNWEKVKEGK